MVIFRPHQMKIYFIDLDKRSINRQILFNMCWDELKAFILFAYEPNKIHKKINIHSHTHRHTKIDWNYILWAGIFYRYEFGHSTDSIYCDTMRSVLCDEKTVNKFYICMNSMETKRMIRIRLFVFVIALFSLILFQK